jgi:hypothetical protein
MTRVYASISDELRAFLERQPMFFVATAPLSGGGHVNVSPKGVDGTFAVLGPLRVAYLDLTGSGVETIAHARENGRITMMFCAFDGPARIVRLYGQAEVVTCDEPHFDVLVERFPVLPGARAVVSVVIERIADSCGYGVPRMELVGQRDRLLTAAEQRTEPGLAEYRALRNAESIDGLPGF